MKIISNRANMDVEFYKMKEGTVFIYDGRLFMKVCGVTENTVTEGCIYAVDLTCGELHDLLSTNGGQQSLHSC